MGIVTKILYEIVYRGGMAVVNRAYYCNLVASGLSIAVAVVVYFFVLIKVGGLREQDIAMVPKGDKLIGVLKRVGWL